ncbi:hypothetical protein Cni_G02595 [Canna indica]|uniref:Uncharacterized protein n=1 Tax=Canna indica TaxID=4628 RepID=A0AAQ3Q2H4_9LILI|nr:hypothetical protein Cni_G02595 [Canna indica]
MHNMSEEVPIIVQPTTLNENLENTIENTIDQGTEWSTEYENSSDEIIIPETSQEGVPYTKDEEALAMNTESAEEDEIAQHEVCLHEQSPFTGICLSDVMVEIFVTKKKKKKPV